VDTNVLYYGDNLSNRDYNVIFKDESGRKSDAQLLAFEDTWHWGPSAETTYAYLTDSRRNAGRVPHSVSTIIAALRQGIGTNQMMAYLVEMAARLVELHRTLKGTGSLYLHCDTTASHYLRVLLDAIFGPENFRNEVVWWYRKWSRGTKKFLRNHDVLLFYAKSDENTFNILRVPLAPSTLKRFGGRRQDYADETRTRKITLDMESEGGFRPDVWELPLLPAQAAERLGYPTQKPLALMELVIRASSNPGDVVLDPFCGCGTTLVAAEKLGRRWIGIDVTYLSIAVMRARLKDSFGLEDVRVIGQPTEVEGARQLAQSPEGRYQFQWWVLGLVDARPLGGVERKGSDRGIDGLITFTDKNNDLQSVLVSVKSGHVNSGMVRDLKGTMERERAAIGLFITLEEPSKEMLLEASTAGIYRSDLWNREYPRVQVLSISELLEKGKKPELPPFVLPTYQQAERVKAPAPGQEELFGA
jgi:site-specific DNA-methyltransferase (adenine-specific)